jgi:hypothetical protein
MARHYLINAATVGELRAHLVGFADDTSLTIDGIAAPYVLKADLGALNIQQGVTETDETNSEPEPSKRKKARKGEDAQ